MMEWNNGSCPSLADARVVRMGKSISLARTTAGGRHDDLMGSNAEGVCGRGQLEEREQQQLEEREQLQHGEE